MKLYYIKFTRISPIVFVFYLESIKVWERKLETLDGIKSPTKVIDGYRPKQEDDDLSMSNNAYSSKRKANQVKSSNFEF